MNIEELINRGVSVTLSAHDLREYSLALIRESRKENAYTEDEEWSEDKVAEFFGVRKQTVQRWRSKGLLKADYMVGCRHSYKRSTVMEFKLKKEEML